MADITLAHALIDLAHQDLLVFRKLAADLDVGDTVLGFHAQQAVEKALKAVLAHAAVRHRRTHDIAELLDLLTDAGLPAPPHAEVLDELNPYAVEMRYGLIQPGVLDRQATLAMIDEVVAWASQQTKQT
jgi:HEPN domain-containing protein